MRGVTVAAVALNCGRLVLQLKRTTTGTSDTTGSRPSALSRGRQVRDVARNLTTERLAKKTIPVFFMISDAHEDGAYKALFNSQHNKRWGFAFT